MYHDHSQAIYQILLTHYLYFVFSHHFCSVVFTDITFVISIFFVSWSKLSSSLRIQTRANFREPALGSSGLSRLFFFHSCSRMNYFSATIFFFRLLICYPTVAWSRRSCSSICGIWCCCCLQLRVPQGGQLLGFLLECWYFVVLKYGGNFVRCHLCLVFNSERIFATVWFIFQRTICCWKSYFFNHLFFATLFKSHFRMGVLP